jgi:PAS domain S-box-containing protein
MDSQAEVVLSGLFEVYDLENVQEIVDRVCRRVVQVCPFELALISLYFGEDVYIGLEGGDERMRQAFLDNARTTTAEARARKRARIWRNHRIPGTSICFIPEGSEIEYSSAFKPSEPKPGQDWQPNDRLMVFVRGLDDEVLGVLSLDRPADGKRPDPENLGRLLAIDRFVKLVGVLIHNQHLAAKLRESEERYAAVVEQGHDGILIVRDGKVLFANRRLGQMLGIDRLQLRGRDAASIVVEENGNGLPGEREGRLLAADGRTVDVSIRSGTIQIGGAEATAIAVADITERKRIYAQLIRAQKMEGVGTMASGIAHDFNNLLGGILGFASLLRTQLSGQDKAQRYVDSIEKAADRAADVTRQLLGIVRDKESSVQPFPVSRVLGEIASLLEETLDPSIRVRVRCATELPEVLGDESQLHQVILNMCLNARDAMAKGGTLSLSAHQESERVRILVQDTGEGMDAATAQKIFDPFFTTKTGGSGTGLGLYMAYRVIERHGGTIDVSSAPGEGTTFEITLPAAETLAPPELPALRETPVEQGGTILLVDDEEIMQEVGTEMLRGLGYDVITANNGLEAVDIVGRRADTLRAVVLDIAMPVMNGWEAAEIIREAAPQLPILLSSGHDVDAALGNTHGLVGAHSLKKPYRVEDLKEALEAILTA